MGRRFDDETVQRDVGLMPFKVAAHSNGDASVRDGRQEARPSRSLRYGASEAQAGRRGQAGRDYLPSRHHGARLLQRQSAQRDEGRGPHSGPRGASHHQRAHGRVAGVRPREERRRDYRGLRLGRRHLRHYHPAIGRGRLRGEGHKRGHAPGRRRTSTSGWWTGSPRSSSASRGSISSRTAWPCSACARLPSAPRSSSRPSLKPRSTCHSSPRTPRARSTL